MLHCTALPAAAYATNQAGKIVFDPSQSTLLQTTGAKTIVISATGYSTNSITQTLVPGTATQLIVTTQPTTPAADGGNLAAQPVRQSSRVDLSKVEVAIRLSLAFVRDQLT